MFDTAEGYARGKSEEEMYALLSSDDQRPLLMCRMTGAELSENSVYAGQIWLSPPNFSGDPIIRRTLWVCLGSSMSGNLSTGANLTTPASRNTALLRGRKPPLSV